MTPSSSRPLRQRTALVRAAIREGVQGAVEIDDHDLDAVDHELAHLAGLDRRPAGPTATNRGSLAHRARGTSIAVATSGQDVAIDLFTRSSIRRTAWRSAVMPMLPSWLLIRWPVPAAIIERLPMQARRTSMIYELRIYEVVPGQPAGPEQAIRDDHPQDLGAARHQAGRVLDRRRGHQQRADLPHRLGEPGRARGEVDHVPGRSGVDREARPDRGERRRSWRGCATASCGRPRTRRSSSGSPHPQPLSHARERGAVWPSPSPLASVAPLASSQWRRGGRVASYDDSRGKICTRRYGSRPRLREPEVVPLGELVLEPPDVGALR